MPNYQILDSTSIMEIESGSFIIINAGLAYRKYQVWVDAGNTPRPIQPSAEHTWDDTSSSWIHNIEIVRAKKLVELGAAYLANENIATDCTTSVGVISMDSGQVHAMTLKAGFDLATLNTETMMDIVDFYDAVHADTTLTDVQEIMKQQGTAARENWAQKVLLKRQVLDATTIAEVEAISWV